MLAIKGNIRYKQCTRPQSAANVMYTSHGALGRILGALLRHSSATSKRRPTDAQHHPRSYPSQPSHPPHQRHQLCAHQPQQPWHLQQVPCTAEPLQQLLRRVQLQCLRQHPLRLPDSWWLLAVATPSFHHPFTRGILGNCLWDPPPRRLYSC